MTFKIIYSKYVTENIYTCLGFGIASMQILFQY